MNLSKLVADIQTKQDILSFIENGGTIKVGKAKAVRKCQTFRNNKYSAFNLGAKCLNLRARGIYANSGA